MDSISFEKQLCLSNCNQYKVGFSFLPPRDQIAPKVDHFLYTHTKLAGGWGRLEHRGFNTHTNVEGVVRWRKKAHDGIIIFRTFQPFTTLTKIREKIVNTRNNLNNVSFLFVQSKPTVMRVKSGRKVKTILIDTKKNVIT